jgi:protein-disulfide isomerase
MKQKTLFITSAIVLLLVFFIGVLLYTAQPEEAARPLTETHQAALVRMHSPTLGNAAAPVVIVEFLDPACETCRAFYPRVKQMMAAHPDKIRLVLRYAPFHPDADKVVAMLEAARQQNKFWPALEALLANQSGWTENHRVKAERAWAYLDGIGLDREQLARDMNSPAVSRVIEQDLADARTLNVNKTPEFFVNGKPLPSFGFDQLQRLVDQALAEANAR